MVFHRGSEGTLEIRDIVSFYVNRIKYSFSREAKSTPVPTPFFVHRERGNTIFFLLVRWWKILGKDGEKLCQISAIICTTMGLEFKGGWVGYNTIPSYTFPRKPTVGCIKYSYHFYSLCYNDLNSFTIVVMSFFIDFPCLIF